MVEVANTGEAEPTLAVVVEQEVGALRSLAHAMRAHADGFAEANVRIAKNLHGWADQVMQTGEDLELAYHAGHDHELATFWRLARAAGLLVASASLQGGSTGSVDLVVFDDPTILMWANDVVGISDTFRHLVL